MKLEETLKKIHAGKVIDIASGGGQFIGIIKFMTDIEEIHALEVSDKAKPFIEKNFPEDNIIFHVGKAEDLPFEDESYDTVTISSSLHHLESPEKALSELARMTKAGRRVIINEMVSDENGLSSKSHVMVHHWAAEMDRMQGITHNPTFSSIALKAMIEKSFPSNSFSIDTFIDPWDWQDPFDEQLLDKMKKNIDFGMKKAEKFENKRLIEEGKKISDYIQENGYSPAKSMFFIITKK